MRLPTLERLELDVAPLILLIGGSSSIQGNQDVSDESVAMTCFTALSQNCSNPRRLVILLGCNALVSSDRSSLR